MNSSNGSFFYLLTHLFFHYSSYPFSQIPPSFLPLSLLPTPPSLDPFLSSSLSSFFSSIHPSIQSSFCLFTCVFFLSFHSSLQLCFVLFFSPFLPSVHSSLWPFTCLFFSTSVLPSYFPSISPTSIPCLYSTCFFFDPSFVHSSSVHPGIPFVCPFSARLFICLLCSVCLSFTRSHSLKFISFTGLLTLILTQLHLSSLSFMIHLWVVFLGKPLLESMRPWSDFPPLGRGVGLSLTDDCIFHSSWTSYHGPAHFVITCATRSNHRYLRGLFLPKRSSQAPQTIVTQELVS